MGEDMSDQLLAGWLSEQEVAEQLRHHWQTVRRWRLLGIGPKFSRCGRKYLYQRADVAVWLAAGGVAAPKPQRSKRAAR